MKTDVVSRLRTAEINCDDISLKNLLSEAADKIEDLQREKDQGIILSGNDVINKIRKINEERAKQGLPPI